jgi:cytidyltransferase-like protein
MANPQHREMVALFPASFDPITNGHMDVVERALGIFDRLVLAVAFNTEKEGSFTKDERLAMLNAVFSDEPRIEVTAFDLRHVERPHHITIGDRATTPTSLIRLDDYRSAV